MGEGLQVDRVPASEARRYAIKRVACESCFSEGATRGVETDGGSTLLCETCAARAGGVQYERHDTGLLPGDGPVVALILSAMSVADEVGCGPSEALGLLDRAHCRVVCGLMRFVPRRHSILPGLDLNDRLVELLGVVVGRSDEAAAFLREQMAAQLHRYEEKRAEALSWAADAQRTVVGMCRRARDLAQPAVSILDDLQEQVEARYRAHGVAEDVAMLHSSLASKLNDLRAAA